MTIPWYERSIVPALAKSARAGHPEFRNGKERARQKGGAPGDLTTDKDASFSGKQKIGGSVEEVEG